MTEFEQDVSTVNRRQFIRIPAHCQVVVQKILFSAKGDTEAWGKVKNIGAGGILFISEKECRPDDMLKVTITLPGWKKHHPQFLRVYEDDITPPMTAVCQVLRSMKLDDGQYELAAKFINVYEDDLTGLQRFIETEAYRLGVAN
ncbi:MAG: PilZ domain-containing protein [candidate division Zixibacteria bacterium]|nr:PilZ domain-containing protein [candidate division Zixibacteria bacterium]